MRLTVLGLAFAHWTVACSNKRGTIWVMDIKVTLLLCEFAKVTDGLLTVVGGGWTQRGPLSTPSAVAALVSFPFSLAPRHHLFRLQLVDADGRHVLVENAEVAFDGTIDISPSPDSPPYAPVTIPFAFVFPLLPLEPASYSWQLLIDGSSSSAWSLPFQVLPHA